MVALADYASGIKPRRAPRLTSAACRTVNLPQGLGPEGAVERVAQAVERLRLLECDPVVIRFAGPDFDFSVFAAAHQTSHKCELLQPVHGAGNPA